LQRAEKDKREHEEREQERKERMENQRRLDESNKFGLYAIMNCDRKKLRLPPTLDPDVWGLSMKRAKPNV